MFKLSSLPSLEGKVFLVTGGNTGVGYATCLNLAAKGARVYMGARSSTKASAAILKIKGKYPSADLHILIMDHMKLSTINEAAKMFSSKESKLNGLILNAGIMAVPYELTADGFESQMQVNYLAHWLLTYRLLPILLSTARKDSPGAARIVCVSSEGHRPSPFGVKKMLYDPAEVKAFGDFGRYGLSKLGNVLHAKTLHAQYGSGSTSSKADNGEIWTAALHPGFIDTQMNEKTRDKSSWYLSWIHPILRLFGLMRPWDEGAVSSCFVAASNEFEAELSGLYFDEYARVKESSDPSMNLEERLKLEDWTKQEMKAGGWI